MIGQAAAVAATALGGVWTIAGFWLEGLSKAAFVSAQPVAGIGAHL